MTKRLIKLMVVDRVWFGLAVRRAAVVVSALVAVVALPLSPVASRSALASSQCQVVNTSPHSVPDGSDDGFSFNILDNSDAIAWVHVTTPSQNVVLVNAASDWLPNAAINSYDVAYSGATINPGTTFEVDAEAVVSSFPAASWVVQASTDPSGSNPFTCSGDTSLTVTDTTPPHITNISVQALATSASISWDTDKATTGQVNYGKTASYGSVATDSQLTTGHQLTLSNITPATTYHYKITATDQFGNTAQSIDGTFFTASVPVSETQQPASNNNAPVTTEVTTPADKTPPTIVFTTSLPQIVKTTPKIDGTASDDNSVAKVEYSTDAGQNWLPVDSVTGLGSKKAAFSFTPLNLQDNTYTFMARAIDGGGNITTTKGLTTVLDSLPPIVGGSVISVGPQVLTPDAHGIITTLPNVNLTINISATGGANSVRINAVSAHATDGSVLASFILHQVAGNGLWTGILSFTKAGDCQLVAASEDGAGNKTSRVIGNIHVVAPGATLSANGPVANAKVKLYYLDSDTNEWITWDGSPYGQSNPQQTDTHGRFSMLLPAGTYYAHVDASGYQSADSAVFTLDQTQAFNTSFTLLPSISLGPIRLPSFSLAVQPVALRNASSQSLPSAFTKGYPVGTPLGNLTLTNTNGAVERSVNWLGKPTVVSALSDWAPAAAEEIGALSQLAGNSDVNVKVIGLQEGAARLNAVDAIAGSNLVWLADPVSTSLNTLPVSSIPANYFVDRKGVIQSITYGPMSYRQLLDTLTNLP